MSVETINSKITQIIGYKSDIKSALIEKGSSISDTTLLADYDDKIRELVLASEDSITEIEYLRAQVETLTAEKTTLQGQVDSLTTENASLETQVSTLTSEKSTLEAEITNLTAQLSSIDSDLSLITSDTVNILGEE